MNQLSQQLAALDFRVRRTRDAAAWGGGGHPPRRVLGWALRLAALEATPEWCGVLGQSPAAVREGQKAVLSQQKRLKLAAR